jgi:hypothetical protein
MRGYSTISMNQQAAGEPTTRSGLVPAPVQERRVRLQRHHGPVADEERAPRLQHNSDGSFSFATIRQADDLLGTVRPQTHIMKANFVWDLPDLKAQSPWRAVGLVVNDWQLSGSGRRHRKQLHRRLRLTLTGCLTTPPASGSSATLAQAAAAISTGSSAPPLFRPLTQSVGLESETTISVGASRACSISRSRATSGCRAAPSSCGSTCSTWTRPASPDELDHQPDEPDRSRDGHNLPFDANGNLIDARSRPRGAGFGVVNNYQAPRTVQALVRFSF